MADIKRCCREYLKLDREVILAVLKQGYGWSLEYATNQLKVECVFVWVLAVLSASNNNYNMIAGHSM